MQKRSSSRFANQAAADRSTAAIAEPPSKRPHSQLQDQQEEDLQKLDKKLTVKTEKITPNPGHGYVSPYETAIQKNIKERMEMLKMLQIDVIKEEVKASMTKAKPKKRVYRNPAPVNLTPSRRSLRISGRDPAGAVMPQRPTSPSPEPEPRKLGKEAVTGANAGYSASDDMVQFMSDIRGELARQERRHDIPEDSYTKALTGMVVTEDTWTKVTPQRIASLAFCPLRQKHVVAAGDKRGILGLWDASRGDDGVHMLKAHSGHIVGLSFEPQDGGRCFTTSYDGITRCLDMEKLQFDQVYATPDSDRNLYLNHHAHVGPSCLLIGQSDGQLVRRDLRSAAVSHQKLSDSCLRFLSVHPCRDHCLLAVERPSTVSLWDLRHVKGPRSALQRLPMPRACSSASISLGSGDQAVALSSDDTIRLYQGVNQGRLNPTKTIRHDNRTGRWLTTFKPTWLPNSDDLFVVGSMQRPRRMEVFDRSGPVYHILMGEEMQAVCSTIACHPSQPAIAGGNSSGKVFLYK